MPTPPAPPSPLSISYTVAAMTATDQLLESYQQDLTKAAARMDNAGGDFKAYRNAQADWCNARDIIQNLRTAHLSREEIEAAEAIAENDHLNAGPSHL